MQGFQSSVNSYLRKAVFNKQEIVYIEGLDSYLRDCLGMNISDKDIDYVRQVIGRDDMFHSQLILLYNEFHQILTTFLRKESHYA